MASLGTKSLAGDPLEGFYVLCLCLCDDLLGHDGAVLASEAFLGQPVAEELLVEAVLGLAGLVSVQGPEARGVRGENLVDEDDLVGDFVVAELELGVCNDDASLQGVEGGELVQPDGDRLDVLRIRRAHNVSRYFAG